MKPITLLTKLFDAWWRFATWIKDHSHISVRIIALCLVGAMYREVAHDSLEIARVGQEYYARARYHYSQIDWSKSVDLIIAERELELSQLTETEDEELEDIFRTASIIFKVPMTDLIQIWNHESGGLGMRATRTEEHKIDYAMTQVPEDIPAWARAQYAKMLATSWGGMQVMGYNAKLCKEVGVDSWQDLNKKKENIMCGALIYAKGYHSTTTKRKAKLAYNGGGDPEYPDRVMLASRTIDD